MFCKGCLQELDSSYFFTDKNRKSGLSYYCKSCHRAKLKQNYLLKREKRLVKMKEYYHSNSSKLNEKSKIRGKEWRSNNKDKNCFKAAKYRTKKLKATPSWADFDKIQMYYGVAAFLNWLNCGFIKYHVDHIVPLQGKMVCGLHVHDNLQVLLAQNNLKKHNKLEI